MQSLDTNLDPVAPRPAATRPRVPPLAVLEGEGNGPIGLEVNLVESSTGYDIVILFDDEDLADHDDTLNYGLYTGNDDVVATLPTETTLNGNGGYLVSATTDGTAWSTQGQVLESPTMTPGSDYNFTVTITDPTTQAVLGKTTDPIIKVYHKPPRTED